MKLSDEALRKIERLLVNAYQAGQNRDSFDMLAAIAVAEAAVQAAREGAVARIKDGILQWYIPLADYAVDPSLLKGEHLLYTHPPQDIATVPEAMTIDKIPDELRQYGSEGYECGVVNGFNECRRLVIAASQQDVCSPTAQHADTSPGHVSEIVTSKHTCEWWEDGEDSNWQGSCGAIWQFTSGGPFDNDMGYCPGCGGRVLIYHVQQDADKAQGVGK